MISEQPQKSSVWRFFTKVENTDGSSNAICTALVDDKEEKCNKQYKFSGSTTILQQHLEKKHYLQYQQINSSQEKQLLIDKDYFKPKDLTQTRKQIISQNIARYIAFDMRPLRTVEQIEFINLIKFLEPGYKMVSRKELSDTYIPKIYQSMKNLIIKEISNSNSNYGITLDHWTSFSQQSYLTLTIHFVDIQFRMKSYVIMTKNTNKAHTALNISEDVEELLLSHNIKLKETKIISVTDGAPNLKAAMRLIGVPQMTCFAHLLNSNLKCLFKVQKLEDLVNKCRILVKHFRQSSKNTELLRNCQQANQMKILKLKIDIITRWNSVYDMLDRLIQNRKAINLLAIDHIDIQDISLSSQEWLLVEKLVKFLTPFYHITTLLSASSYPTLSMISPIIENIKNSLLIVEVGEEELISLIKRQLMQDFSKRIDDLYENQEVKQTIFISTYLDPRFKDLEYLKEQIFQNKNIITILKEKLIANREKYINLIPIKPQLNTEKRRNTTSNFSEELLSSLFGNNNNHSNNEENTDVSVQFQQQVENEIYRYELSQIPQFTENILEWWRTRQDLFHILSQVTRQYHCVPATSVPSEEIFSKAGFISNERRSLLGSKMLDQLLYISKNQKQFQSNTFEEKDIC